MSHAPNRIRTIDAIRGFAVCGIFAMNVVGMGLPAYAYVDPNYYGGAHGVDLAAWALAYVLADGKMRALFTMLLGASLLIVADGVEGRSPGPARTHYARMVWLFLFGMIHAWAIWYGDILVDYALVGALAFAARRWRVRALLFAAVALIAWQVAQSLVQWHDLARLQSLAGGADPPGEATAAWRQVLDRAFDPEQRDAELRLYRGSFADVFDARWPVTLLFQTIILPLTFAETLGFCALGMALHRLGFWQGALRPRTYAMFVGAGAAAILLYVPLARAIVGHGFDPAFLPLADALSLLLRPWLALAYAAAIVLLAARRALPALVDRLAAAGRMALSNYLGTSLVATTLFYGYGLGLFGRLSRAELYLVVLAMWCLILGWSAPWLARFRYGPFEWLWRSLARGRRQPMRVQKDVASCSQ